MERSAKVNVDAICPGRSCIMSRLERLYELTLNLQETLISKGELDHREEVILKVTELIDQREDEMTQLTPPYTEAEKEVGQKIVQLNKEIEKKMDDLFSTLKKEMTQFTKQKKTNHSYINPYGNMSSTDGMYVDSKQ